MTIKVPKISLDGFDLEMAPETVNRGVSLIVYSNPGVGKTTLLTTLPPDESLIINVEAGLGPMLGKGHAMVNFQKANENSPDGVPGTVNRILQSIRLDGGKTIKNVAVDNISELLALALNESTVKRSKAKPELNEFGENAFRALDWMHQFRDLTFLGINVIFNAWEQITEVARNDGTTITMTTPMIGKKTAIVAAGIVDAVGHLEVHEKTGKRWIRFGPSDQYLTKCQFNWIGNGEIADLPMLFDKIKGFKHGTSDSNS